MSVARHHAEWLSLVEVSGPFLSLALLEQTFPQGIETVGSETRERLHLAHEEWLDGVGRRADPALHHAWVRFVFREALGYDERDVLQDEAAPCVEAPEHRDTLRASFAVKNPEGRADAGKPRLLVSVVEPGQNLDKPLAQATWKASPVDRLLFLVRGLQAQGGGARVGLVTNGSEWVLLHVAPAETTTYVRWSSELWFDEPLTLRAFVTLVGVKRLFGVPDDETLEALIGRSSKDAHDVTDKLGAQVRRATEVLVQTIDRLDRGRQGKLLEGIAPATVYEAAVTVMMRLIFVLAAEERKLLLLGMPVYDQHYALSTLHDQLQAMADRQGEEVLEKRFDAWCRLLSTFRGIFGGVEHSDLRLPAHGGSLFDPDRFAFLEGRQVGTSWRDAAQQGVPPLAVDNRTVLHLLRAITRLEVKAGGGRVESRRVSFRALDVEQIGHVYEGLLDHTAKRATDVTLSLQGKNEPEIAIAELEARQKKGKPEFVAWLAEATGRGANALSTALEQALPPEDERVFLQACDGQPAVLKRVHPWAGLVRRDTQGRPVVIPPGALYVTEGADRRSTGTHYTPRSLTEPIVQHTLEPLVYEGPAEGKPREAWRLKSTKELLTLRVCDLAMGSGAFLVEACRYLSARLVESWAEAEARLGHPLVLAAEGELARGDTREQVAPADPDERLTLARRLVADRCLYGVDINPYAVEMAKLSLWLTTMQKGRPFTFVDHALRCGDSLLGVSDERQLLRFHLDPARFETRQHKLSNIEKGMRDALARAREIREKLEDFGTDDINDALRKAWLLKQANETSEDLRVVGDLLMGAALTTAKKGKLDDELEALHEPITALFKAQGGERQAQRTALRKRAEALLNAGREAHHPARRPFHWAIEFPETVQRGGFDAFVGNPPFKYGTIAAQDFSEAYMRCLQSWSLPWHGKADLVVGFIKKAAALVGRPASFGLISTAGIIRGESLESGIRPLVVSQGWKIRAATSPRKWPGGVGVDYVAFVLSSSWNGECLLDGVVVSSIGENLEEAIEQDVNQPFELENGCDAYMGVKLSPLNNQLRSELAAREASLPALLGDVVVPAVGGDELYNLTDLTTASKVVDSLHPSFFDDQVRQALCEWLGIDDLTALEHSRPALALKKRAEQSLLLFACGETSVHLVFRLVPPKVVTTHKCIVIPSNSWHLFSFLQSTIHGAWALRWGLRRRMWLNYSAKRCAQTFVVPGKASETLSSVGMTMHEFREKLAADARRGLTSLYGDFHERAERGIGVRKFRELHVEMDEAVKLAYGWGDLRLEHGFHETKQGVRYTISEAARVEVLDRLLALNHERHAEEARAGLHPEAKKGKAVAKGVAKASAKAAAAPKATAAPKKRGKAADETQRRMLGDDDLATISSGGAQWRTRPGSTRSSRPFCTSSTPSK